jgi:hypothetical protein
MESAVKWTDVVTAFATVAASIATLATLIFFGLQLRTQSRMLRQQREATTDSLNMLSSQIKTQNKQARIEAAAAELSVNLSVMTRLQEVLYEISDDEETWKHIWGSPDQAGMPDCKRPILGVWAILDVLSLALTASGRLPDFSRNAAEDWIQYSLDTLHQSEPLRVELGQERGLTYWPELGLILMAYNDNVRSHEDYLKWLANRNRS